MDTSSENHQTQSLIALLKSKNKSERSKAFENIYVTYFPVISKFIRSKGGGSDEAKDIFQEGITIMYTQIVQNKFRGESNVKTYLFSICRNLWYKQIKQNQNENEMKNNQLQNEKLEVEEPQSDEKVLSVFQLFNTLGQDCQKVLELFYFEKLSMSEIAVETGLKSEQSAKNKKSKCLKQLRSIIAADPSVNSLFVKR